MDQQLINASQVGDIHALYSLIREDPYLLEHIDAIPLVNTPLHVAASAGQAEFAKEMMALKPSFAKKLNQDGFSPMHLASQNGHWQVVLVLLEIDGDLVRIKGREGFTPFMLIAMSENISLLSACLSLCPKSIEDVNIRSETALHITLKNDMREAFAFLLQWICQANNARYSEQRVLNQMDVEGNTLLHVAAFRNQAQFVSLLLNRRVNIHAKNSENLKALDFARGQAPLLEVMLSEAEVSALPSYAFKHRLRMDEKLKMAAEDGSIEVLHFLLEQDPHLLVSLDTIQRVNTPLHVAAMRGQTSFALEIVSLQPSLAVKLNQDGLSPLHLALREGQTPTAIGLVKVGSELVRIRGNGRVTPLHFAAEKGNVELLVMFLRACPSSIEDLTIHCQTAVHVAVENKQIEAFEFLFGWLHRKNKEDILNWKDNDGNTVLHVAVQKNEPKVVELLINNVDSEARNLDNLTAMDIFMNQGEFQNSKIKDILNGASLFSKLLNSLVRIRDKYLGVSTQDQGKLANDVRNIVLVVAVLIATATYQAVLSPPGGYWQDDYYGEESGRKEPHRAGTITMDGWESSYFALLNSAAFCASVSTIIILMMGLPFALLLVASTVFISFSYFFTLHTLFPALDGISVFLLSLLRVVLFSVHVLEFEVHRRQRERRMVGLH